MIEGVRIKKLKLLPDDRGFLMEMLRCDDEVFENFGQVYITGCIRGVVKGWHYHKEQTDNFVCVYGKALVVLCDLREGSPTYGASQEFFLEGPPASEKQRDKASLALSPSTRLGANSAKNVPPADRREFPTPPEGFSDGNILLQIPPLVVHGFTAYDCDEARMINIPTRPYRYDRPDEYRYPWNSADIPYKWPAYVTRGG